jgi:cephalosporin hydroxylase
MAMRWVDDDVGGLHDLCKTFVTDTVVEIGSYWGESAVIFAKYAKLIYCIDPWVDVLETGATADGYSFQYSNMAEAEAKFDFNTLGLTNVIKIRGHSNDLADVFGNKRIHVVYIDSLHHYSHVRSDIDHWWRIVKPGGWLAGHNYGGYWPGVFKAVNESFGKPDKTFRDTSWAVQKKLGRRNA